MLGRKCFLVLSLQLSSDFSLGMMVSDFALEPRAFSKSPTVAFPSNISLRSVFFTIGRTAPIKIFFL